MAKASRRKRGKRERIGEGAVTKRDTSAGSHLFQNLLRIRLLHLALLVFLGFAAYSATFHVPFQFDDVQQIMKNPVITNMGNFFSNSAGYDFNPRRYTGYLSFALNYRLGGYAVAGYHMVNLTIHLINGILVYLLVMLTLRTPYFRKDSAKSIEQRATDKDPDTLQGTGRPGGSQESSGSFALSSMPYAFFDPRYLIALFSSLLFVVHPLQTQAVTYIVQRLTSLAAMFYLLSIVMYAKARLSSRQAGKLASFFFSLVFAVLAMKTKEIAFTLPLVVLLYEFLFFKSDIKKKILTLLPVLFTLAIIPVSILGTHKPLGELLSDLSEKTRVQTNVPRWDYLMTQIKVVTTYIRLLFLPMNQNLDYDYPIYHSLWEPSVLLSCFFLLSLMGVAVYLIHKSRQADVQQAASSKKQDLLTPTSHLQPVAPYYRLISFGILWFFVTLSVESSVIPIADVIFEHRVYLPSVGAFMAITAFAAIAAGRLRDKRTRRAAAAFSVIVIAALSVATYSRNMVWHDRLSLWQDVVHKSPDKGRGYNDLGNAYNRGGMLDKAIVAYRRAITLSPDSFDAHNDLGIVYAKKNRTADAIREFRKAMELKPNYAKPHSNLGIVYAMMNNVNGAIDEFSKSIALNPKNSDTYKNRGVAYTRIGEMGKASEDFQRACAMGNRESCEYLRKLQSRRQSRAQEKAPP